MKEDLIALMMRAETEGMLQLSNDLKRLVYRFFPGTDLVTGVKNLTSTKPASGKKAWVDLNVDPKLINKTQPVQPVAAKKGEDNDPVQVFDLNNFVGFTPQEVLDSVGSIKELRKVLKKAAITIDHTLNDEEFLEQFIVIANAGV